MFVTGVQTCALPILSSRVLKSWLVAINTARNICAHHGRLWNRGLGTRPTIPTKSKYPEWHEPYQVRSDNMFGILTILSYLLERIAPETGWRTRLFELLDRLDADELHRMGFAEGWQGCPLWEPYLPAAELGKKLERGYEERGDRKSTRLNSSHKHRSRMPSSA